MANKSTINPKPNGSEVQREWYRVFNYLDSSTLYILATVALNGSITRIGVNPTGHRKYTNEVQMKKNQLPISYKLVRNNPM